MNAITRRIVLAAALVLALTIQPTWGGPPNPTDSDANDNTAGGTGALLGVGSGTCGNPGGCDDTAFGFDALTSDSTGNDNTASGAFALKNNTTGNNNTATGTFTLEANTTGSNNTAIGFDALLNNNANANTAVGVGALRSNNSGSKNTALGNNALSQSNGNRNIAIGNQAGATLVSGNNNIYLGNPGASESQTIRIGTAQTRTFIAGIATTGVSGATVEIDANGQLGIGPPSSVRYKREIAPMGTRSAGVLQLRPVTFAYRDDAQRVVHYGLVAEEVALVYPELVVRAATGEVETVKYLELIPMLLNELQRQHEELATLRALVEHRQKPLGEPESPVVHPPVAEGRTLLSPQ